MYEEAISRAYLMSYAEIEEIESIFKTFHNIRHLKFNPEFKKNVEKKHLSFNKNAKLKSDIGLSQS